VVTLTVRMTTRSTWRWSADIQGWRKKRDGFGENEDRLLTEPANVESLAKTVGRFYY
jgi:hypothetical protein